jgi:hypothetical protein
LPQLETPIPIKDGRSTYWNPPLPCGANQPISLQGGNLKRTREKEGNKKKINAS